MRLCATASGQESSPISEVCATVCEPESSSEATGADSVAHSLGSFYFLPLLSLSFELFLTFSFEVFYSPLEP